jgi:beta-xylosidase
MKKIAAAIPILLMLAVPATGGAATHRHHAGNRGKDRAKSIADPVQVSNPVQYHGGPMGCADPDVFNYQGGYVASCTSGASRPALPIYYSPDLVTWTLEAYINPPASMMMPGGQVWADEIHYLNGLWTAWYALQTPSGQMVIAESWSPNLFASNWQTKIVYTAGSNQWAIDPSVQWDTRQPETLDMVFQVDGHIYIAALQGPNFQVVGTPRQISAPTFSWENGWEEGPVLWDVDGQQYLFMNVSNTWNGTYAIGVEHGDGPALTGVYIKQSYPLVQSDPAFPKLEGPGIGAQPFIGPHGEWVIAYHVDAPPNTYGLASRPLCFQRLYLGPSGPYVAGNHPWPTADL